MVRKIMKNNIQKLMCLMLTTIFLISSNAFVFKTTSKSNLNDIDPTIDLSVTVEIKKIRALDKIDLIGNPNFYVKVLINGLEYKSPTWYNMKYVENPQWSASSIVPNNNEWVNITLQLWDRNKLCDISNNRGMYPNDHEINLQYSIKTGHWVGDDYAFWWDEGENGTDYRPIRHPKMFDPSGYGRANGCDDNSIYQHDRDCELWFDISQTCPAGDNIPYWMKVNVYKLDPTTNYSNYDPNNDGIPITWDWKWGYDPFAYDNHSKLDPDLDGLNNYKEYLTSQWGSDPFRKDIFLEIDQMKKGPNGEGATLPELSKDLLADAFSKHNIVFHIDDGSMGGGELIPFDNSTTDSELQDLYFNYFLHGNSDNWRRGVFHYALIIYNSARWPGFGFRTTADGVHYVFDSFQISTLYHETDPFKYPFYNLLRRKSFDRNYQRTIVYAGVMMHETGHVLGILPWNSPGCDNWLTVFPNKYWWKFHNYISCMNYNNVYYLVDYSDGSHGKNDFDDWDNIDLTLFQQNSSWH